MMALALACGPIVIVVTPTAPSPTPTPFPQPTAVGMAKATPTPLPPSRSPTPTPLPPTPACVMGARLVADVTVPDNTAFAPGTSFIKTWRVRNSGTCAWEPGTWLVFVSGEPIVGPAVVDVNVSLVAPAASGNYRANYQLQVPDGNHFGPVIWVQIVVLWAPTATPVPVCTPPPCPPDIVITCPTPGGCGLVCVMPAVPIPVPCVPADSALAPVVGAASGFGLDQGCPTGQAFSVYGAFQKFETNPEDPDPHAHMGAFMIWRSDIRRIYVLGLGGEYAYPTHNGRWLGVYDDLWEEGRPEVHLSCAGMRMPSGFQFPIRGFGKVWCENSLWALDRVGWIWPYSLPRGGC